MILGSYFIIHLHLVLSPFPRATRKTPQASRYRRGPDSLVVKLRLANDFVWYDVLPEICICVDFSVFVFVYIVWY